MSIISFIKEAGEKLFGKKEAPAAPPAATPEDVVLLREIRDALKQR